MSANNTFSLLNETEGSDTSYRNVHLTRHIHFLPGMAWSDTLKEDFGYEPDTVAPEPVVKEVEVVEIVEEKAPAKKSKKGKKPAQQKPEDVDLDTLFKEMGVELNETVDIKSEDTKKEPERKKQAKKNSKAASIIANETAQRRNMKKKGKK